MLGPSPPCLLAYLLGVLVMNESIFAVNSGPTRPCTQRTTVGSSFNFGRL